MTPTKNLKYAKMSETRFFFCLLWSFTWPLIVAIVIILFLKAFGLPDKSSDSPTLTTDTRLVAMLVTTNLVSVPCQCGFCRPEEGIAVLEHINRIGYDLKLEINTNYLPVVKLPIPANSSVISPFTPRRYVLTPAAVAAKHLAALTNCLTNTIVTNLPPPAELPSLADIAAKDVQGGDFGAWTNAPHP